MDSNDILLAYKSGVKTCKQIEQGHEHMKGQHELMFKAWQEKSKPLLTEDEKLISDCNEALLTFKQVLEIAENKTEAPSADYEKIHDRFRMIVTRHKNLKDEHESFFHEMMGH